MLTYHLQKRSYKTVDGSSLIFPNPCVLEIKLGPQPIFGAGDGPCRFGFNGEACEGVRDLTTGLLTVKPKKPIPPISAIHTTSDDFPVKWEFQGDVLRCSFDCKGKQHLSTIIFGIYYLLIPLLNLGFADPPFIVYVRGWLSKTEFYWIYKSSSVQTRYGPPSHLNDLAESSLKRLQMFYGSNNRRLAAALHYLHVACRLLVVGQSLWEFISESVLNMAKSLEIMFGGMDEIRKELTQLDYSTEEIEGDFIPILVLRSFMDVAHPKIAVPNQDQLEVLYTAILEWPIKLSKLFDKIITMSMSSSFQVTDGDVLLPSAQDQKKMERLIATLTSRQTEPSYKFTD